jgi:hypothetical protein
MSYKSYTADISCMRNSFCWTKCITCNTWEKCHPRLCKNTACQQGHVTKQGTRECQTWSQSLVWTKCTQNHRGYVFERNKFLLVHVDNSITNLNRIGGGRERETNMQLRDAGQCHSPYSKLLKNCPWRVAVDCRPQDLQIFNPQDYYLWGMGDNERQSLSE